MVDFQDFKALNIRVGTIIEVEDFPKARKPAYKLSVDLGKFGIKKSSAQITDLYEKNNLLGKQVVCVCGFNPKQIGTFMSEVLVTGFITDKGVVLAGPDTKVENGLRLL